MGAWIEIRQTYSNDWWWSCRTLYGCVDWNFFSAFFFSQIHNVAPFMGAWIEIIDKDPIKGGGSSRTLYGCVDWNVVSWIIYVWNYFSRTLYGCVDWNFFKQNIISVIFWSHPLWVRGLKYHIYPADEYPELVAPFMGAWIEIPEEYTTISDLTRRTLYGCVDWNSRRIYDYQRLNSSHPLWVRGLK